MVGWVLGMFLLGVGSAGAQDAKLNRSLETLKNYQGACFLLGDDENMDPDKSKSAVKNLKADCKLGIALALTLLKKNPKSKPVREAAEQIADSAEGAGVEHAALNQALGK